MDYLTRLRLCIDEKIYFLSVDYDKDLDRLVESYQHRKEIISKTHPEYQNRQSHIMYYAYKGVERDLIKGLEKKVQQ